MFAPKVSVIVPVYNLENYIEKTIRSLQALTYNNFEIVIVDDGSTDSSLSIIKKMASEDSRIIFVSQSNGGAAKARNTGLTLATGEFITFVDGDDMLSTNAIADNIGYFTDKKIDWVAFSIRRTDADGGYIQAKGIYSDFIVPDFEKITSESYVPYFYTHRLSGVACAAIYRKSSIETISFTEGKYYEDSIFFIDLLCNTENAILSPKGEYLYVDREDSSQKATLDYKHMDSQLYVANKRLVQYRERFPMYESYYRQDESNFYYFLKNENAKENKNAGSLMKIFKKNMATPFKINYKMELKCIVYHIFGYNRIKRIFKKFK